MKKTHRKRTDERTKCVIKIILLTDINSPINRLKFSWIFRKPCGKIKILMEFTQAKSYIEGLTSVIEKVI